MDEGGELIGDVVFEVIELVGEHTEPRLEELGDASFEEKFEAFGDAIEHVIDEVDITAAGEL